MTKAKFYIFALLLMICQVTWGQTGKAGDNVTYTFYASTGEMRLTGTGKMWDFYERTDFDSFKQNVKSISVEYGVTDIGFGAFKDFTNLETVNLPSGLKSIDNMAFMNDTSLKNFNMANTSDVNCTIWGGAFDNCLALETLALPDYVTEIPQRLCSACPNLKKIYLPHKLKTIPQSLVDGSNYLESITIPASVTTMYNWAITACPLKEIIFLSPTPPSVTIYGYEADEQIFRWLHTTTGTRTLICPPGSEEAYREFASKHMSEEWTVEGKPITGKAGDNVTYTFDASTGEMRITGTGRMWDFNERTDFDSFKQYVKSLVMEEGVTTIGFAAFHDFKNLETVNLPTGLEEIGPEAFKNDTSLKNFNMASSSNSRSYISFNAFQNCSSLETLTIPDYVSSIPGICRGCTNLKEINLPNNLEDIYLGLIEGSDKLESITIPASVKMMWNSSIGYCPIFKEIVFLSPTPPTFIGNEEFGLLTSVSPTGKLICPSGSVAAYREFANKYMPEGWTVEADSPVQDADGYYQIATVNDLIWFRDHADKAGDPINARQTADIDLSSVCGEGIGSWEPIGHGAWYGKYDGQNHKITNLYIDTDKNAAGLFYFLGYNGDLEKSANAEIKNLKVSGNVTVNLAEQIVGAQGSSILCTVNYCGKISHCEVVGSITTNAPYAGGICGSSKGDVVFSDCKSNVTIKSSCVGNAYVGGIVGVCTGYITRCMNYGDVGSIVEGSMYIGGIAGSCTAINAGEGHDQQYGISYCANSGNIIATKHVAGIVARYRGTAPITSCWNTGTVWIPQNTTIAAGNEETLVPIVSEITEENVQFSYIAFLRARYGVMGDIGKYYSTTAFKNGRVAAYLGKPWGQRIGTDDYPVLDGPAIYAEVQEDGTVSYTEEAPKSPKNIVKFIDLIKKSSTITKQEIDNYVKGLLEK